MSQTAPSSRRAAPRVSLVVPVLDEEESLPELWRAVHAAMTSPDAAAAAAGWEVIFVDDGSRDRSPAKLNELYAACPEHVRVVSLRRNYGQSAAIAAGFEAAAGDVIVAMDADLQNDPGDIPALLAKLACGYDVVSGWRRDRQDRWLSRRLPSQLANRLISWFTGVRLNDYGCTLKAYRREIAADIRLYGELHRFLPALAHWNGARVTELVVGHHPRRFGRSKYGLGRTLTVLLDLITVKFLLSYATRPMQVFGKLGLAVVGLGGVVGAAMVAQKLLPPYQDMTDSPLLYLTMLCFITGLQLLGLGLLSEINVRTYFESQGKRAYAVRSRLPAAGDDPSATS